MTCFRAGGGLFKAFFFGAGFDAFVFLGTFFGLGMRRTAIPFGCETLGSPIGTTLGLGRRRMACADTPSNATRFSSKKAKETNCRLIFSRRKLKAPAATVQCSTKLLAELGVVGMKSLAPRH